MPGRGNEVIRQWTLLRALASSRRTTIDVLADELDASTRTVRRDLDALQAAGFPIEEYDDEESGKCWRLPAKAMARLERSGLTFSELASLYLSRALFECFAESALLSDLQSALDKVDAALSPATRKFLDRLPHAISAKSPKAKRQDRATHGITMRLLEAIMALRIVSMKYDSRQSRRLKTYSVHPYRIVHAEGGLYLIAFVPEYGELRTFAVERIRQASADKLTFEPIGELESDPFAHSIGAFRAQPVKVQLRFAAALAERIKERNWHHSQQFRERSDGSLVMTLHVSDDQALRSWILSFGSGVRVLAPTTLADWVSEELDAARAEYGDDDARRTDPTEQPALPFVQLLGRSE